MKNNNKSANKISLLWSNKKNSLDWTHLALWAVLVSAFFLRIYHLSYKSISIDESIGFFYIVETLKRVIIFTINDVHPPFFYIVHHFWIKIFGTSEAGIRSISVFFGILSILGLYKLGSLIFNRTVGLIAAFMLAISPWHIWISQNARSNSMFLFLSILSIYSLFRIIQTQRKKWFFIYALVTVISLYTHYFAFTLWIAQGLYMLFNPHSRKRLSINFWRLQLAILISYCFWLPFMISQFITKTRPMYKSLSLSFFKNLFDIMNAYISEPDRTLFIISEFVFLALFIFGISQLIQTKHILLGNGKVQNQEPNSYKGLNLYLGTTPIIIFILSIAAGVYFNLAKSLPILKSNIALNEDIFANTIMPYHIEQLKSLPVSFFVSAVIMILLFLLHKIMPKIVVLLYKIAHRINRITHKKSFDGDSFSPSYFFLFQFLVPIIVAGLASLKSPYLIYRNMVIVIPFYFLIISYTIAHARLKSIRSLVLLFILLVSIISFKHFEEWNVKDNWRSAAITAKANKKEDDIILLDHLFGKKPFYYYGLKSQDPLRRKTADSVLSRVQTDIWFLTSYANKWSAENLLDKKFIRYEEWQFEGTTNPDDYRPRDKSLHLIHYKNPNNGPKLSNKPTLTTGTGISAKQLIANSSPNINS